MLWKFSGIGMQLCGRCHHTRQEDLVLSQCVDWPLRLGRYTQ